jgi:cytochrome c553
MLHALQSYKSGARQNGIMQGIVATLSAQDMEDVTAYYAAQPGALKMSPH